MTNSIKNRNRVTVDIEDIKSFSLNNVDDKTRDIEILQSKMEGEVHSILFPRREGKKNFRALSAQDRNMFYEEHPFIDKVDGEWQYRTYIGYFSGKEEGNKMLCTSYSKLSNLVTSVVFIVTLIPSFIVGFKAGMTIIKKLSSK